MGTKGVWGNDEEAFVLESRVFLFGVLRTEYFHLEDDLRSEFPI